MRISTTYTIKNILKIASFQILVLTFALGVSDDFKFTWLKYLFILLASILFALVTIAYNRYVMAHPKYKQAPEPKYGQKTWAEHQADKQLGQSSKEL